MEISPFLLERHFANYEFEIPFQLSCSDCEPFTLAELLEMAPADVIGLWENLRLSYTESKGNPLLRKEISSFCNDCSPEEILICVPEEGIFLVMNSLLNKGDHLVVISPAYQSLYEIASAMDCRISLWEADQMGNFPVAGLKSLIEPDTRLVVINFPHNPTGKQITGQELLEISRFCNGHRIILFSDEMYRGLEFDPADRLPSVASLSNRGITLSGMSKSFALPGLRIGWLVAKDQELREKLIRLKDYTTICASAPSEILSIIALRNRERILARNIGIINENIRLVDEFVCRNRDKVSWNPPMAGSVALLYLLNSNPVEKLCLDLLEKKQVLAIGSHLFNYEKPSIRLGLGRIQFPEALARLEELLRD